LSMEIVMAMINPPARCRNSRQTKVFKALFVSLFREIYLLGLITVCRPDLTDYAIDAAV
jgi:hypothetical protein